MGEEVTAAQLLGREEEEQAVRLTDAEEKLAALLPRVREMQPLSAGATYEVVDEV